MLARTMGRMFRVVMASVMALGLAGCGFASVVDDRPPVPAGPLGPIVQADGGGPPVECRGVPIEQCKTFGNVGDDDVVRYIVTCMAVCTPQEGDARIDALRSNGTTVSMGSGSWESAQGAPATPEPTSS